MKSSVSSNPQLSRRVLSDQYGYPIRLDDFDEGKPLTVHSTKGKTPAEAALLVMKYIHKEMGLDVKPVGFSSLDKLYSLRTGPAIELLNHCRWSDFFEGKMREHDSMDFKSSKKRSHKSSSPNYFTSSSKFSTSKNLPSSSKGSKQVPSSTKSSYSNDDPRSNNSAQVLLNDEMFAGNENRDYFFSRLISRTENFWNVLKISTNERNFYRDNLCVCPLTSVDQCRELARYVDVLNSHRYKTIEVLRCINLREHAVMKLSEYFKVLKKKLFPEELFNSVDSIQSMISEYWKEEFIGLLKEVQISTVNVIRHIQLWRRELWRPHAFIWNGRNYFNKMRRDLSALLLVEDSNDNAFGQLLQSIPLFPEDLVCVVFRKAQVPTQTQSGVLPTVIVTPNNVTPQVQGQTNDERGETNGNAFREIFLDKTNQKELSIACNVVLEDKMLQQSLQAEIKVLRMKGVFIPTIKFEPTIITQTPSNNKES